MYQFVPVASCPRTTKKSLLAFALAGHTITTSKLAHGVSGRFPCILLHKALHLLVLSLALEPSLAPAQKVLDPP